MKKECINYEDGKYKGRCFWAAYDNICTLKKSSYYMKPCIIIQKPEKVNVSNYWD